MIGVYNHLLSKVFRFHYHSQKVIGSLGKRNAGTGFSLVKCDCWFWKIFFGQQQSADGILNLTSVKQCWNWRIRPKNHSPPHEFCWTSRRICVWFEKRSYVVRNTQVVFCWLFFVFFGSRFCPKWVLRSKDLLPCVLEIWGVYLANRALTMAVVKGNDLGWWFWLDVNLQVNGWLLILRKDLRMVNMFLEGVFSSNLTLNPGCLGNRLFWIASPVGEWVVFRTNKWLTPFLGGAVFCGVSLQKRNFPQHVSYTISYKALTYSQGNVYTFHSNEADAQKRSRWSTRSTLKSPCHGYSCCGWTKFFTIRDESYPIHPYTSWDIFFSTGAGFGFPTSEVLSCNMLNGFTN